MIELMPQLEAPPPPSPSRSAPQRREPAQDFRQSLQHHNRGEPSAPAAAQRREQATSEHELEPGDALDKGEDVEAGAPQRDADAEAGNVESADKLVQGQVSGEAIVAVDEELPKRPPGPQVSEALAKLLERGELRGGAVDRETPDMKPGQPVHVMRPDEAWPLAPTAAGEALDKAADADKAIDKLASRLAPPMPAAPTVPSQAMVEPGGQASTALANLLASVTADGAPTQSNQGQTQGQAQSFTLSQPLATPEAESLNAGRLARGLQAAIQHNGGAVTLRLTPPELGTVRIELTVTGSRVAAQLHTQNDAARNMLQQQLAQLRHGLEAQGLQVERLGVQSQAGSNQAQAQSEQSPHDGRSRGEHHGQSSHRREQPNQGDRHAEGGDRFDELLDEQA